MYVGTFWQVEHAYPSGLLGWLVIVLRRHAEALHELESSEFEELGRLLPRVTQALHNVVRCDKEYVACFAEIEHFKHIHFHVIPRARALPNDFLGTKSFAYLKVPEVEAVLPEAVLTLCEELRAVF